MFETVRTRSMQSSGLAACSAPDTEPARSPGLAQHLASVGASISRASELVDMILEHVGGPFPAEKNAGPPSAPLCLLGLSAQQTEEAAVLGKKLETILQLLGR